MDKDRHVAIWLRMCAAQEIRTARLSKNLFKTQGSLAARAFEKEGKGAADEIIKSGLKQWVQILIATYISTIRNIGVYTANQLRVQTKSSFQRLVDDFIMRSSLTHSALITETSLEIVRKVIADGFIEGLNEVEIGKNINEALGADAVADYRSRTIARTETHNAATFAMQETARESKLPLKKQWVSVHDDRVRGINPNDQFDHVSADGQIRGLDEPFDVSGERLDRPGDPAGSLGNILNCRCTIIYLNDVPEYID